MTSKLSWLNCVSSLGLSRTAGSIESLTNLFLLISSGIQFNDDTWRIIHFGKGGIFLLVLSKCSMDRTARSMTRIRSLRFGFAEAVAGAASTLLGASADVHCFSSNRKCRVVCDDQGRARQMKIPHH